MGAKCGSTTFARGGRRTQEVVEVEQQIAASIATVFSYLTDPEKFVLWMGVEALIDPRPGGEFRLDVDGQHIARGRYEIVDPPHRLVLSWGWEGNPDVPPGSTKVEITLTEHARGTLLRLRHIGLPTEEERANHAAGWRQYSNKLRSLLRSSSRGRSFTRL